MSRRTRAAAAAILLTLTLTIPVRTKENVARFYVNADGMDSLTQELSILLHTRGEDGVLNSSAVEFKTPMNRFTRDGAVYIVPLTDGVWATVDRLYDADGNGVYEMTADAAAPVWSCVSQEGTLVSGANGPLTLEKGKTCALSADTLSGRRLNQWDATVYLVTIRTGDGTPALCYYLRLYDELPILSAGGFDDLRPGAWYYGAVDYVLARGLMAGVETELFSPTLTLSRAMLAQILYGIADKPAVNPPAFSDVRADDWFASAVAWADGEGLMNGVGGGAFGPNTAINRQQIALILLQYARGRGGAVDARADLSVFSDVGTVADWGREAMEWAVACGLLTANAEGALRPNGAVTRAEAAVVLRGLWENILP